MRIAPMVTRTVSSGPATDRGETTRRQILDVAASAFADHGYRGISLNDIVRESGLTKGAFYFHFPSKEALALAVFRDKQERWVGEVMAAIANRSRAVEQLEAMFDVGCEIYEKDSSARVVGRMCVELFADKQLTPHVTAHLTAWFDMVEELLVRAQDEGDVRRDVDARSTAETMVAAFIGIEQVSDELSGLSDLRGRVAGLRTLVFDAIVTHR
jgi:AcrR family transcriptional regulator